MKKILLLPIFLITLISYGQQTEDEVYVGKGKTMFQDNFSSGVLSNAWKINSGKWYITNLDAKRIQPPVGDNNFALASGGDGEIMIDISAKGIDPLIPVPLSLTYWVHSKESKGVVSVVFLNDRADSLKGISFEPLQPKEIWAVFNQEFKVPKGTSIIRLKLAERGAASVNTVYFKNLCVGCRKR